MGRYRVFWFARMPVLFLLLASGRAHSADSGKPDFSGSYSLTGAKGALKVNKTAPWLLRVVQSSSDIEITRTADGKVTTNQCKLDGTESSYTSSGGVKLMCTVRFNGKTLILETWVGSHPQANGTAVQIHTKQQWTLSSNTLTIRNDVDFPKSGLSGFQLIEPWSEIYIKNQ
jgi:hypothetical protein